MFKLQMDKSKSAPGKCDKDSPAWQLSNGKRTTTRKTQIQIQVSVQAKSLINLWPTVSAQLSFRFKFRFKLNFKSTWNSSPSPGLFLALNDSNVKADYSQVKVRKGREGIGGKLGEGKGNCARCFSFVAKIRGKLSWRKRKRSHEHCLGFRFWAHDSSRTAWYFQFAH